MDVSVPMHFSYTPARETRKKMLTRDEHLGMFTKDAMEN
jgi:hypothetical protein